MKTTVEMAKEAGFTWEPIGNIIGPLERFEALVRASEREACAKVCDDYDDEYDVHTKQTVEGIALQIRNRGNT
jgi:hypothetical protein